MAVRLQLPYLNALHEAVVALRATRASLAPLEGYEDVRAVIHAHSQLSHDSRGTREEIVAAAHAAGVRAILMTEHPAPHFDFYRDGLHGTFDGVLFYPGAEARGFLNFPTRSLDLDAPANSQELIDRVTAEGGLIFIAHSEEHTDWALRGITGMEIYNTHTDYKDEPGGFEAFLAPAGKFSLAAILQVNEALKSYPNEILQCLFDPQVEILRRWDELNQTQHVTGIAANDSHSNTGLVITYEEGPKLVIRELLGDLLAEVPAAGLPVAAFVGHEPQVGETILRLQFDPYEISFGYVSTHLLVPSLTEANVLEALKRGRCYVGFDWIADPTGFSFFAQAPSGRLMMGEEGSWQQGVTLRVESPLAGRIVLLRDGATVSSETGTAAQFSADKRGVYRVEVWLSLAGEPRPWIYSNPIYLR